MTDIPFKIYTIFIKGGRRKKRGSILPKIDNGRNHLPTRTKSGPGRLGRPSTNGYQSDIRHQETLHISQEDFRPGVTPLTLELQHGNQKQSVSLPTDNLDKAKKYYVTFTINKSNGNLGDHLLPQKDILQDRIRSAPNYATPNSSQGLESQQPIEQMQIRS